MKVESISQIATLAKEDPNRGSALKDVIQEFITDSPALGMANTAWIVAAADYLIEEQGESVPGLLGGELYLVETGEELIESGLLGKMTKAPLDVAQEAQGGQYFLFVMIHNDAGGDAWLVKKEIVESFKQLKDALTEAFVGAIAE
jgi:hypothetical protein